MEYGLTYIQWKNSLIHLSNLIHLATVQGKQKTLEILFNAEQELREEYPEYAEALEARSEN